MIPIQVLGWNSNFENFKSRTYDHCSFVCIPNKQDGLGMARILSHPQGAAIYGVFHLILGACSRQKRPRDGWMTEDGTAMGEPWTIESMSLRWRRPAEEVAIAVQFLGQIGWLKIPSEYPLSIRLISADGYQTDTARIPTGYCKDTNRILQGYQPDTARIPTGYCEDTKYPSGMLGTEQNRTEQNRKTGGSRGESEQPDLPEDGLNEKPIAIAKESGKEWPSGKIPAPFPALPPSLAESPDVPELWDAWNEIRRKIRKPLTPRAASMAIRMLEGLAPGQAAETLRKAVVGGHQGLYPPQGGKGGSNGKFSRRCEVGGGFDVEGSDMFIEESVRLAQEAQNKEEAGHEQQRVD